jgi:hypothetical protein
MVHCRLDTELPLDELRVSVTEKRELDEPVEPEGEVTLSGLPEGELHLVFFHNETRLGEIEIGSAESGELIRLKIRLVAGNAILLEESRISGLSETTSRPPSTPASPVDNSRTIDPKTRLARGPSYCPPAGEVISRSGNVTRIIDREAFEIEGEDRRLYVVYVGSATRLTQGSVSLDYADLLKGMRVNIRGTVAAGPEDQCSIGARQITVERR